MSVFVTKLKNILYIIFVFLCMIFLTSAQSLSEEKKNLPWHTSAGNYYSERFFSSDQINKYNVENLSRLWTFNSGSTAKYDTVQSSPIFIGDQLLLVTLSGELISISPDKGELLWKKKLKTPLAKRGFTYYEAENPEYKGIYVASGKNIIQISRNGEIKNYFSTGLSLVQPFLDENKIYVATVREGIKAFDLESKRKVWSTSLKKDNVNARVWSGFSFDKETESLFVVTSNPGGIIGENRSGDDFSASLISLDSNTGKIKWQYKHIVNDVWDYDLISNPIIVKNLKLSGKKKKIDCVIALSKTGDVIMVDIATGLPVFENSYVNISVQKSDMENVFTPKTQKLYLNPEKFSSIEINFNKDFQHLSKENFEFIQNKLRHAKSGFYVPTSTNYDVVIYGVHGGAEWPGATIYRDNNNLNLIIPSNNTPWILRIHFQDQKYLKIINNKYFKKTINYMISTRNFFRNLFTREKSQKYVASDKNSLVKNQNYKILGSKSVDTSYKNRTDINNFYPSNKRTMIADLIYKFIPGTFSNKTYSKNCASCHGNARQGRFDNETRGDNFYPSLVGITKTKKWSAVNSYKKVLKIHSINNINLDLEINDYKNMMNYFNKYDEKLFKENLITKEGFWQILLDKDGLPATKPPWGKITNINLTDGKKLWEIPFGQRKMNYTTIIDGDQNFGGVISTKGKIIFANGNPDSKAYAFNLEDGKKIWETNLPYAGSAPPMAYNYKGCDIIVFTSTGGRFVGYQKNGDSTVAYKLKNCNFN